VGFDTHVTKPTRFGMILELVDQARSLTAKKQLALSGRAAGKLSADLWLYNLPAMNFPCRLLPCCAPDALQFVTSTVAAPQILDVSLHNDGAVVVLMTAAKCYEGAG